MNNEDVGATSNRPRSVVISLVVFGLLLLFLAATFLMSSLNWIAGGYASRYPAQYAMATTTSLVKIGVLLLTFWGTLRRRAYGRWMGLLVIALITGLVLYSALANLLGWPTFTIAFAEKMLIQPKNDGQKVGQALGGIIADALFLIAIYHWARLFAFTEAAKKYWTGESPSSVRQELGSAENT